MPYINLYYTVIASVGRMVRDCCTDKLLRMESCYVCILSSQAYLGIRLENAGDTVCTVDN